MFERQESPAADHLTKTKLESTLARAEEIFASTKSLVQGNAKQSQNRTALQSEIAAELQRLN